VQLAVPRRMIYPNGKSPPGQADSFLRLNLSGLTEGADHNNLLKSAESSNRHDDQLTAQAWSASVAVELFSETDRPGSGSRASLHIHTELGSQGGRSSPRNHAVFLSPIGKLPSRQTILSPLAPLARCGRASRRPRSAPLRYSHGSTCRR